MCLACSLATLFSTMRTALFERLVRSPSSQRRRRYSPLPSEPWLLDTGYFCELKYFDLAEPIQKDELDRPIAAGPFDRNGNVMQKYMVEVDPDYADSLASAFSDRWPTESPLVRRFWIFQCVPSRWNLVEHLRGVSGQKGRSKIGLSAGSEARCGGATRWLFGRGAMGAGIYAIAQLTGVPEMREKPSYLGEGEELRVDLRLLTRLRSPLLRSSLLDDPVLKDLTVIRAPQATKLPVIPPPMGLHHGSCRGETSVAR